jgi:transposase-like protein
MEKLTNKAGKQKSTNGRAPGDPESPMQKSKPKYSRFSQEQKAVLTAEVEQNGAYVDNDRRLELARQLGVEENTIKVWI